MFFYIFIFVITFIGFIWYTEYGTPESADDVEKQELEEVSDEEETYYFDANEYFQETTNSCGSIGIGCETQTSDMSKMCDKKNVMESANPPTDERRKKLPDPVEKEKAARLWSVIKDMVGKDLTRVCLPVYFNEPISSLQKCFEELEYSYLLDRAYEHGKKVQ